MTMTLEMTAQDFTSWLDTLIERDDYLCLRAEAEPLLPDDVTVDLYVLSAHLEALRSDEIDGQIMDTLQDLEYTAQTEEEAWRLICQFYTARGCTLLQVPPNEGYIIADELAHRLKLIRP